MPYKDPERYREYQAAYQRANRDRIRETQREWRKNNLERARKHAREWARRNRPQYVLSDEQKAAKAERMSAWWAENPERRRSYESARRARKLNQFVEDVNPEVVYQMHGGRCGVCGEFIEGDFHVDHITPLSKGGMHGYVNVQPAHPICNLRKGDRV